MKTASLVLGIIGGVLAIIFAIIFIAGGALLGGGANAILDEAAKYAQENGVELDAATQAQLDQAKAAAAGVGGTLLITGIIAIVGAILGIVGGALAKKKGILAGIFMVIAAVANIFTGLGIIATILFVIGAVLAFIPEKPAAAAAA